MLRFRVKVSVRFSLEVRKRSMLIFNLRVSFSCRVSVWVRFNLDWC